MRKAKTTSKCCKLDTDHDGNCPIHSSPGVLRDPRLRNPREGHTRLDSNVIWPNVDLDKLEAVASAISARRSRMTEREALKFIKHEFEHFAKTGKKTTYTLEGMCLAVGQLQANDMITNAVGDSIFNKLNTMADNLEAKEQQCRKDHHGLWFKNDRAGAKRRVAILEKMLV